MAGSRNGVPRSELPFPDNLTPTERRIYEMLSDGERHTKPELFSLLDDQLSGPTTVRKHICTLGAKLPPDRMILCECAWQTIYYRMVCPLFPNWLSPRDLAGRDVTRR